MDKTGNTIHTTAGEPAPDNTATGGKNTFAGLAYASIGDITALVNDGKTADAGRVMHETLAYVCYEALKDSRQNYGNLFSQVDFLCRRHNISLSDRAGIQLMRRHSNLTESLTHEDLMYDLRALCLFTSAVTATAIPGFLLQKLPAASRPYQRIAGDDVRYVRCIITGFDENFIYVSAENFLNGGTLAIDYTAEDLVYLKDILKEGCQLNLLDCKVCGKDDGRHAPTVAAEKIVTPGLVIFEPDYLLDISSIAACFKDYGSHPLNYIIDRMRPKANGSAILTGNLAGHILDEVISRGGGFNLGETLKANFCRQALEYSACKDFNAEAFKAEAVKQAANIQKAVNVMSGDDKRDTAVLEPSFVCERLGLQGRADLMTTDFGLLVEQKSGKNINIEYGRKGKHGSVQLEPHYIQLLLYYGVLRYNFNLGTDRTDIRLLYSKYPPESGLLAVAFYRRLFKDALRLRNETVSLCRDIALSGFEKILPRLSPDILNTAGCRSAFYNRYLLPQITAVTAPLKAMPPLEKAYFCRMMTFVFREQLLAKTGRYEGNDSCAADLWNMPLCEKIETGNIYLGLTVAAKEPSSEGSAPDRIRLRVPRQTSPGLPNFRRGDMVYLYSYGCGQEPDARKSLLYKAVIADIRADEITLVLTNGQNNPGILEVQNADGSHDSGKKPVFHAVEHASTDSTSNNAVSRLLSFITAPEKRRDLLLGRRRPERDTHATLSRSYNAAYDDILLAVKQAADYYLLAGPPGTGKTSMALRFIVEEELAGDNASILMLAYTNRAVDEICEMLDNARLDYIRIGGEHSADRRYKSRLLAEKAGLHPRLTDIKRLLTNTRIIVCTTSTLMSRPFIFAIKSFSLAVIDEASQIIEPDIIGLLAASHTDDDGTEVCNIRKFVMTGDYKQLPAVVRQSEKEAAVNDPLLRGICLDNCRDSLFERLLRIERKAGRKEFAGVLRRHGRMHPEVSEFPCNEFYADEQLTPVPLAHQKETSMPYAAAGNDDATGRLLREKRMIFIPSAPCSRPDISDKMNAAEAAIAADLLRRIYMMTGAAFDPRKTVGVIVPYRNQIAMIRSEIEKTGIKELEQVSIDTVERYQGSQREVIIYSFTVQKTRQLEFLTANTFSENGRTIDRKLNVALTRARRQMIITGNEAIISKNPLFNKMINFIRQQGGVIDYDN